MRCKILKSFLFSSDGVNPIQAVIGDYADIPADLVAGLESEGFVEVAPAETPAEQNKMIDPVDEIKEPVREKRQYNKRNRK